MPFATGVSLGRDDLHVFVFGGDGDGFSIGGNHLDHAGRKNIRLTYVIMDNFVYGLTKKHEMPGSAAYSRELRKQIPGSTRYHEVRDTKRYDDTKKYAIQGSTMIPRNARRRIFLRIWCVRFWIRAGTSSGDGGRGTGNARWVVRWQGSGEDRPL